MFCSVVSSFVSQFTNKKGMVARNVQESVTLDDLDKSLWGSAVHALAESPKPLLDGYVVPVSA